MQVTRLRPCPTASPRANTTPFLEASYIADLTVDGQPLNAYAKALATFGVKTAATSGTIVVGADWALDKNLGRGQVYDMLHPLSSDAATRRGPTATFRHSTTSACSSRTIRRSPSAARGSK